MKGYFYLICSKVPFISIIFLLILYFYTMFYFNYYILKSNCLYYILATYFYLMTICNFILVKLTNPGKIILTNAKYKALKLSNHITINDDKIEDFSDKISQLEKRLLKNKNILTINTTVLFNNNDYNLQGDLNSESYYTTDYNEEENKLIKTSTDIITINERRHNNLRYCSTCLILKPDRAYHCKICKMCILKLDHHCPWVDNCIGLYNQKYFILFLLYSNLSLIVFIIDFYTKYEDKIFLSLVYYTFVVVFLLILCLLSFQVYILCINQTNYEYSKALKYTPYASEYMDKRYNRYDRGLIYNLKVVLGVNIIYWLLPIINKNGNNELQNDQNEKFELEVVKQF